MHLRDQTTDGKWTETVGAGNIDFKAIGNALKKQTTMAGQPLNWPLMRLV
jgi:hypothetical protein